ncbi:MAG TPA: matrixin family metalloprotease [Gemmatimonadetes bacterium]|nr:matrixin family metalloprotease [Gemmatimonadota bacterium]
MLLAALLRSGRGPRPLTFLAAILVFSGILAMLRSRIPTQIDLSETNAICEEGYEEWCDTEMGRGSARRTGAGVEAGSATRGQPTGPVLSAATACLNVRYLCAELESRGEVIIRRWKDHEGTIVVHIPRPDFLSSGDARRLQDAAAAGVRLWNGQPFPISVDERDNRESHFAVQWRRAIGGRQIGVARTQLLADGGMTVLMLELATESPFRPGRTLAPRQVQLTAAHEMGHALGLLMHSDKERDVMYPTNTATSLSARDYRTMEALYELEPGTRIVR